MRKVGLTDYESFAKAVLKEVKSKPISFEVFSDDFAEMRRQALKIHEWQDNVYVKIPITNTSGESSVPLIERLAGEGVKLNITAMLTPRQVTAVVAALNSSIPSILSVFAGRIADTGVDPSPIMKESLEIVRAYRTLSSSGRAFVRCLTFSKLPPAVVTSLLCRTTF